MKKNILFLIIDSLPAYKILNKKSAKIPNIELLINKGINFSQAISSSDGTEVSWASLFTGLHPFRTGINEIEHSKLSDNTSNYFGLLNKNGYESFTIMPKIGNYFGITKDFKNENKFYESNERLSTGLGERIIQCFDEMKNPWIFLIHIPDLHFPIILPKQFNSEEFGKNNYDKMLSCIDMWIGKILEKIDMEKTIVVLTSDHGEYIPSIENEDKKISNFERNSISKLAWIMESNVPSFMIPIRNKISSLIRSFNMKKRRQKIKKLNLPIYQKRALLKIRSDPDGYLFDDIIHVPLIISDNSIKPKTISQQTRLIDVFPTIIDMVNIQNIKDVDGKSLKPLMNEKKQVEETAYFENTIRVGKTSTSAIGIRNSKFKYFRSRTNLNEKVNLYDLKNDPHEENNIFSEKPELIKEMEKRLMEIKNVSKNNPKPTKMKDDEIDKVNKELRKLGYI